MAYAEVAVNAGTPLRQTFSYRVPEGLELLPGHAVYVPFGTRSLQGIVMEITQEPGYSEVRDIDALIDERPVISSCHVDLARRLSAHYLAPLFDCVSLMLPPGFRRKPKTMLKPLASEEEIPVLRLTQRQEIVLRSLIDSGETENEQLSRSLKITGLQGAVTALMRRGFIQRSYRLARPAVSAKTQRVLRLACGSAEAMREAANLREAGGARAQRQAGLMEALVEEGDLLLTQARHRGLTPASQRELLFRGLASIEAVPVIRDPLAGRVYKRRPPPSLTRDQENAYQAVATAMTDRGSEGPAVFLLHGVTGSGKTEVYLAAIDAAVAEGRRAIVLVPEISLTPQTVRRFGERLPGRVVVMHSRLSIGERFDMWHAIREGRYDVVIGARSALFAPQPDLSLVIIDEEHEWTYKQQEGAPRYHARLAARELCDLTGAVLLLGSATPDVETSYQAHEGVYRLLALPDRLQRSETGQVAVAPLPQVHVVDMRAELMAGNRSVFSRPMSAGIREALEAREQVILFLNRRGSASFVQCRDCGHVPQCRVCAVALSYHERDFALACHYCNRRLPPTPECPICHSDRIRPVGLGTERLEEEVRRAFPDARTIRWDRDVTRGRDSHEAILSRFLAHEADVLVGTQMIAKGLDIPLVTLVGVISADIALHLPDFRAGERAYQLLEQVAGRAGRGPRGGRVVIQTYTPQHHAVLAAAAHDYSAMYEREIDFRRRLGYPPFGRLVRLTYSHTGARYAQEQAAAMASGLKAKRDRLGLPNLDILGPAPAYIARLRGRWRWNVVLRGRDPAELLRDEALPRDWIADVDPASLL